MRAQNHKSYIEAELLGETDIDIFQMFSEGSCDTEDWRNYAENTALITGINNILK